jgi:hypothetical protein
MPLRVFTDKLQKIAKEMPGMEGDIEPVDAWGGYVAVDKYAPDNLAKTQDNIQWKIQLKSVNDFDKEVRPK